MDKGRFVGPGSARGPDVPNVISQGVRRAVMGRQGGIDIPDGHRVGGTAKSTTVMLH